MNPYDNLDTLGSNPQGMMSSDDLLKLMLLSTAGQTGSKSGESEDRIKELLDATANQNRTPQMGQSSGRPTGQIGAGSSGVAPSGINNMMTALTVASKIYGAK